MPGWSLFMIDQVCLSLYTSHNVSLAPHFIGISLQEGVGFHPHCWSTGSSLSHHHRCGLSMNMSVC